MLRIWKHKRGMKEVYKVIIELVIAFMVLVATVSFAINVGTGTRLVKEKTARDVALVIETIQASPGAVLFSYADSRGFVYGFENLRVDVYTEDEDTTIRSNTYYFFPKDLALTGFILPQEKISAEAGQKTVLSFRKNPPAFDINSADLSLDATACEKLPTSDEEKAFIVYSKESFFEGPAAGIYRQKVQNILVPLLKAVVASENVYFVTSKDQFVTLTQDNPKAIVLEIYDVYNEDVDVTFFTSPEKKAKRLACITKNLLIKERLDSVIHGESFPDTQNPIVIKLEVNRINFEKTMETLGKAAYEYFQ